MERGPEEEAPLRATDRITRAAQAGLEWRALLDRERLKGIVGRLVADEQLVP